MLTKITQKVQEKIQLVRKKVTSKLIDESGTGIIDYLGLIALGLALLIVVAVVLMAFAPATTSEILNAGFAKIRQTLQF